MASQTVAQAMDTKTSAAMDIKSASSSETRKPTSVRKHRTPHTKKSSADVSTASQASSSSAGSSLASSRVSTPALAGTSSVTSSATAAVSTASDLRPRYQYSREELIKFRESPMSKNKPKELSIEHEIVANNGDGYIWDPELWLGSFPISSVSDSAVSLGTHKDKRKPADADQDAVVRKRPAGNGSKTGLTHDDGTGDDIVLGPQRSSFNSGCQVKRPLTDRDGKRDGRERKDGVRIGSGRLPISERDLRTEEATRGRHDQPASFERTDPSSRRRFEREPEEGTTRNRYNRDVDDGGISGRYEREDEYRPSRFERDEVRGKGRYDREDKGRFDREDKSRFDRDEKGRFDRENRFDREDRGSRFDRDRDDKSRFDRDRDDKSFGRKDLNSRTKYDYNDRRDGVDRRVNKPTSYSARSEYSSGGGYSRNHGPSEPEWYTEGPSSQSDTIELHGFEGSRSGGGGRSMEDGSDRDRVENGSSSQGSNRNSRDSSKLETNEELEEGKSKPADHRVRFDKPAENSMEPNNDEQLANGSRQLDESTNDHRSSDQLTNQNTGSLDSLTNQSSRGTEFDFNEFFRIDGSALGLDMEDGASSGDRVFGSRFQRWFDVSNSSGGTSSESNRRTSPRGVGEVLFGASSVDAKCLLDILHKPDSQTPSLPSMCLKSRLLSRDSPLATHTQAEMVANVKALLNSIQSNSQQPVLPSGGKVLLAEDLEASLRSPPTKSLVSPGSSSTPTTLATSIPSNAAAATTESTVNNVSVDSSTSITSSNNTREPIGSNRHKQSSAPSNQQLHSFRTASHQEPTGLPSAGPGFNAAIQGPPVGPSVGPHVLQGSPGRTQGVPSLGIVLPAGQLGAPSSSGPSYGHVPPGPVPALPAGARVTTLEELEAGLRGIDVSSPQKSKTSSDDGRADVSSSSDGNLSAFNKLLGLVNKTSGNTANTGSTGVPLSSVSQVNQPQPSDLQNAAVKVGPLSAFNAESNLKQMFGVDGAGSVSPQAAIQQQQQHPAIVQQKLQQMLLQQQHQQQQQQQQRPIMFQQHPDAQQLINFIKHSQSSMSSLPPGHHHMLPVMQGAPLLPNAMPGGPLLPNTMPGGPMLTGPASPRSLQGQIHPHSPRAPSPVMFGSQPPMNITAPMPIHSRQRSPFSNVPNAAPPPATQNIGNVGPSRDQLAYMQSLIQKQLYEQKLQHQQQQQLTQMYDRSLALNANQSDNNLSSAVINNTFTPTSVIRKMASMKAEEKVAKEGEAAGAKDADYVAAAAAAAAAAGNMNGPTDNCPMSPPSQQQMMATGARRLVGQGSMTTPAYQSDSMQFGHAPSLQPIGRPIVKGQMPYMAPPPNAVVAGSNSNNMAAEQQRLQQVNQVMQQLRAANTSHGLMPPSGHGLPPDSLRPMMFAGPPPSVNAAANSALLLQHLQRASQQQQQQQQQQPGFIGQGHQPMSTRVIGPPVGGATSSRPVLLGADGNTDKEFDSRIAHWFGSDMYTGHRLPNMPGQRVVTLDEIERAAPPAAN